MVVCTENRWLGTAVVEKGNRKGEEKRKNIDRGNVYWIIGIMYYILNLHLYLCMHLYAYCLST